MCVCVCEVCVRCEVRGRCEVVYVCMRVCCEVRGRCEVVMYVCVWGRLTLNPKRIIDTLRRRVCMCECMCVRCEVGARWCDGVCARGV